MEYEGGAVEGKRREEKRREEKKREEKRREGREGKLHITLAGDHAHSIDIDAESLHHVSRIR